MARRPKPPNVQHDLWRAVDHEGEVLGSFVTKERDEAAALRFIRKAPKRALSAQLHRQVTGAG